MHRRARHLNHGSAGATLYVDSRRITSVSDGSSFQTWSDLSGNSNDLTQATSGYRPVYRTNIIGGQPAVDFANANNQHFKNTAYTISANSLSMFVAGAVKSAPTAEGRFISLNKDGVNDAYTVNGWAACYWNSTSNIITNYRNGSYGPFSATLTRTNWYPICTVMNGSSVSLFVSNAKTTGTTSSTAMSTNRVFVGTNEIEFAGSSLNGYVGCVSLIKQVLGEPLIKRISHSMAFSFKMVCN